MTDSHTTQIEIPQSFDTLVRGVLSSLPSEDEAARRIAEAQAKEKADNDRRRAESWAKFAGPRYSGCTFDNFEVPTEAIRAARDTCRQWAEDLAGNRTKTSLVIVGPVGAGKDHLAIAMCRHLYLARWEWSDDLKRPYGSRTFSRVTGVGLFASWRDAMKAGAEVELRDALIRPDLLLVSDPAGSADRLTEFQAAALLAVVDGRYEAMKPLIVTVNVADRSQLYALLTPPVADRLMHDARIVVINSPSWRTTR